MLNRNIFKLFAVCNIAALLAAAIIVWQNPLTDSGSVLLRGDFPAFYAAGKLVLVSPGNLYNPQAQAQIQQAYWPSYGESFHYFTYPPQMALLSYPLSHFSPLVAHSLWSLLQVTFLLVATKMLASRTDGMGKDWFWKFLLLFSFFPMLIGVVSGQNTALTFLLLSLAILTAAKPTEVSQFVSGAVVGLLAFKPHYALVAGTILASVRGRYVIYGLLLSVSAQLAILNLIFGGGWAAQWIQAISFFDRLEQVSNLDGLVSISHLINLSGNAIGLNILDGFATRILFSTFSSLILGSLLRKSISRTENDVFVKLAFIVPFAVVFLSPHTMYYDTGILLLSFLVCLNFEFCKKSFIFLSIIFITSNLLVAYKPPFFGAYLFVALCVAAVLTWKDKNRGSELSL